MLLSETDFDGVGPRRLLSKTQTEAQTGASDQSDEWEQLRGEVEGGRGGVMDGWLARWTDGSMNCGLINWWNSLGTGEEEDFRASNAQGIFFCFSELFEQSADQLCVVPIPRSFNGRLTGLRGHQTTSLSLIAGGGEELYGLDVFT